MEQARRRSAHCIAGVQPFTCKAQHCPPYPAASLGARRQGAWLALQEATPLGLSLGSSCTQSTCSASRRHPCTALPWQSGQLGLGVPNPQPISPVPFGPPAPPCHKSHLPPTVPFRPSLISLIVGAHFTLQQRLSVQVTEAHLVSPAPTPGSGINVIPLLPSSARTGLMSSEWTGRLPSLLCAELMRHSLNK